MPSSVKIENTIVIDKGGHTIKGGLAGDDKIRYHSVKKFNEFSNSMEMSEILQNVWSSLPDYVLALNSSEILDGDNPENYVKNAQIEFEKINLLLVDNLRPGPYKPPSNKTPGTLEWIKEQHEEQNIQDQLERHNNFSKNADLTPLRLWNFLGSGKYFDENYYNNLLQTIFTILKIPNLAIINPGLSICIYECQFSGIVVDSGYTRTYVTSIYEDSTDEPLTQKSTDFGGKLIDDYLKSQITSKNAKFDQKIAESDAKNLLEDSEKFEAFKKQKCYFQTEKKTTSSISESKITNENYQNMINLPSILLNSTLRLIEQSLFEWQEKYDSFPKTIVLAGGTSEFRGFSAIIQEFVDEKTKNIPMERIKIIASPYRQRNAWYGGSIIGRSDDKVLDKIFISREEYLEKGLKVLDKVPKNLLFMK